MPVLSIVMFVVSLGFLYTVIRQINKNKLLFEQAFLWLLIGGFLLFISVFNGVAIWFAQLLGFELTSNFILSLAVFFLLVTAFMHSVAISQQKEQIKRLVQELSMLKARLEKEKKHEE